MALIRYKNNFSSIHNSALVDNRIGLREKGLLIYLNSKPDGWDFSANRIAEESKDGVESVRSSLKIIESFGYLKREKRMDGKMDYVLQDPSDFEFQSGVAPVRLKPNEAETLSGDARAISNKETNKEVKNNNNNIYISSDANKSLNGWLDNADEYYLDLCERFYNRLLELGRTKKNTNWKSKEWYDAFRLLIESDGVSKKEFSSVMKYYFSAPRDKYTPIADSPSSVRKKWQKLKDYQERGMENETTKNETTII